MKADASDKNKCPLGREAKVWLTEIKTQRCHVQTEQCAGVERKKKKCKQAESALDAAETNAHFSSFPSFQPLDGVYVHKCDPQNHGTKLQECILVAMAVSLSECCDSGWLLELYLELIQTQDWRIPFPTSDSYSIFSGEGQRAAVAQQTVWDAWTWLFSHQQQEKISRLQVTETKVWSCTFEFSVSVWLITIPILLRKKKRQRGLVLPVWWAPCFGKSCRQITLKFRLTTNSLFPKSHHIGYRHRWLSLPELFKRKILLKVTSANGLMQCCFYQQHERKTNFNPPH